MRKLCTLVLCFLVTASQLLAQTTTVTGKVTDDKGAPIEGASIIEKGAKSATTSKSDGTFSIKVKSVESVLTVSAIGFESQTASAKGNLKFQLVVDSKSLNEVVVTGYQSFQKRKYTGAAATVSGGEVSRQTFGSFDQALQGQASGVSVAANSGQPGANAVVRIRGNGSINGGNVPLYIMDGIEISAADFSTLNQGDFEDIQVLKDAVSAGAYGSRGANGVIVITTKRGKAGQLQFNYDAQVGFSRLPEDKLVVMNSDQKITYELQNGNGFYGWTPAEADSLRKVNFNWRDALFQTGVTHQHMISASGGTAASRFYASLAYMDQEGIVKTTGLKRYTARVNVDNNIKNWRFGLNVQAGFSKLVGTSEGNTTLSTPLNAIRWANPYEIDKDPITGAYNQNVGGAGLGNLYSGQPNPAMELFLDYNTSTQIKTVATSYIEFHFPFLKGLYARTNWGADFTLNEGTSFNDPRTAGAQARAGALSRSSNTNFRYTGTTSINYKHSFGKHDINGGLFVEVLKNTFTNFGFTGYGFTNGFTNEAGITAGSAANAAIIPIVGGGGTANGIWSQFALINYGYDNKYFISLVGRNDYSSRFGVNDRKAETGSVGLSWLVKEEKFMSNVKLFDDLKVRASIGTTANNLTAAGDFPIPVFGRASYAGISAWSPASAGNLDYKWEINRTINFGIDFSMLKRRLSGTIELYDRLTNNLYYSLPLDPSVSGFSSLPGNTGKMRNRGIELSLRADIIKNKDFSWSVSANIAYNQNRIIDLPVDSVLTGLTILKEGKPLNTFLLVESAGVNPANGNAQYVKKDKSVSQAFSTIDKVFFGTSDAPWVGGISTNLSYKGFDFGAQFTFFLNRVQYNNDKVNLTDPTYAYDNMHVDVLKEWRNPGDITNTPRPGAAATTLGPANPFQRQTTRFLEDASFWRLRNVTLGYTFKSTTLSKVGIRAAKVFIQGQNLLTFTSFQSFDPETTGTQLVGAQYPALKQTTIGVNIGF